MRKPLRLQYAIYHWGRMLEKNLSDCHPSHVSCEAYTQNSTPNSPKDSIPRNRFSRSSFRWASNPMWKSKLRSEVPNPPLGTALLAPSPDRTPPARSPRSALAQTQHTNRISSESLSWDASVSRCPCQLAAVGAVAFTILWATTVQFVPRLRPRGLVKKQPPESAAKQAPALWCHLSLGPVNPATEQATMPELQSRTPDVQRNADTQNSSKHDAANLSC